MRTILAAVMVLVGAGIAGSAGAQQPPAAPARSHYDELMAKSAAQLQANVEMRRAALAQQAAAAAGVVENQRRDMCETSRPKRVAEAQLAARNYVAFMKLVTPHMKALKARCRIVQKETGAKLIQSAGPNMGLRVSRETVEVLSCTGGIPGGLAEDVASAYVSRTQDGGPGFHEPLARTGNCEDVDSPLGLNLAVREDDAEGIKKLLAWKP